MREELIGIVPIVYRIVVLKREINTNRTILKRILVIGREFNRDTTNIIQNYIA